MLSAVPYAAPSRDQVVFVHSRKIAVANTGGEIRLRLPHHWIRGQRSAIRIDEWKVSPTTGHDTSPTGRVLHVV